MDAEQSDEYTLYVGGHDVSGRFVVGTEEHDATQRAELQSVATENESSSRISEAGARWSLRRRCDCLRGTGRGDCAAA